MSDFLRQLAQLLRIDSKDFASEEELKREIIKKVIKRQRVERSITSLIEESFCHSEITIRLISMINLFVDSLYREEHQTLKSFIDKLILEFSRLLPVENVSYFEKDSKANYLKLISGAGKTKLNNFKVKRLSIENSLAGYVFRTGKYYYVPDTDNEPLFNRKLSSVPIKSVLTVPVKEGNEIIGVMNFSSAFPNAFTEIEVYTLISMANLFSSLISLFKLQAERKEFNRKLEKEVKKKTAEVQKINKLLYRSAITDALTGLYNRRYFFSRLEEEYTRFLRYGNSFCLVIFDLDRLKMINDKHGHLEGDRFIKCFARVLSKYSRKEDITARIGGDEFACIVVGASIDGAISFAERVREELRKVYSKENASVSAGVGCLSKGMGFKFFKNHKEFFKEVDKALLRAKKTRDRVVSIEND